jgi:tyrocidine synthetase-3
VEFDPVTRGLADAWREVLGVEAVDASSSFFDDGGDSLDAVIFVQRVSDTLGVDVSIEELFLRPDFASVATVVRGLMPPVAGTA